MLGSFGMAPTLNTTPISDTPSVNFWNTVTSCQTYEEAQQVVDNLVQSGFEVNELEIVGSDLRLVERVTGPMSRSRAVLSGAGSGAWFGLFVGLFIGLFVAGPAWLGLVLGGVVIGALWGALFGLGAWSIAGGRHRFSSLRTVAAGRYDVVALDGTASRARQMLGLGA
jgi:hypothetical protein